MIYNLSICLFMILMCKVTKKRANYQNLRQLFGFQQLINGANASIAIDFYIDRGTPTSGISAKVARLETRARVRAYILKGVIPFLN
ncbi:MAG: hypothetical protein K2J86_06345, partial [Prevotella sp.]|nr:hypothetical protein [Prevotella sp.]